MTEHYSSAYPSPMGRYHVGEVAPGARLYPIRMLGVPVELFLATRQQHDELMREFAMLALAHRDAMSSDPAELRHLVSELGVNSAASGSRADANVEAASQAGQPRIDLTYRVPVTVLAAADRLEVLMQSADAFCAQGRMLTMPRSPQMLRFSTWWLSELRRQVAGYAPTPWAEADTR